ncbi:TetR/AcrR family transcriptional regulator [Pseudonocardia sp. C8]|uniref:TetR/AcrR family transcriptional regulator n=1 Tax=Pseudonocardia sp. C8 TaxID=2762759 RepID=UPI0016424236|nr:TetR/AcrR family transcriptional regulator [Pseudonocardia sp. C8]
MRPDGGPGGAGRGPAISGRAGRLPATPRQYLDAGLDLLAEHGPAGTTITALCRRLGTTSGSFYHHFSGWDCYRERLVQHWERRHLDHQRAVTGTPGGPPQAGLARYRAAVLALPHSVDAAVRVWAVARPEVAAAAQRVDSGWFHALHGLLLDVCADAATARRLATLGHALVVGCQLVHGRRTGEVVGDMLADFETMVGQAAPHRATPP